MVYCTKMPVFLLSCDPLPLLWKISLAILSWFQKSTSSLRLLEAKSNQCTSSCFCLLRGSANFIIWIILLLGNPWYIPNIGKWSIYSTTSFTQQMNSHILDPWGLNKPWYSYPFWCWSDLGRNKWVIRPFIYWINGD